MKWLFQFITQLLLVDFCVNIYCGLVKNIRRCTTVTSETITDVSKTVKTVSEVQSSIYH